MAIKDYKNYHELLKVPVDKYPVQKAYEWFIEDDGIKSVTWKEFYEDVEKVAKGLIALDIKKDDKVNILSYSRYEWVVADNAIMSIGSCAVGIYQSTLPKDCGYIINHSDSVLIFAEDKTQLKKLIEIRNEIPRVKKVILFQGDAVNNDWVINFKDFIDMGARVSDKELEERLDCAESDDIAGIVYTSGTTGVPKGAMLTHDNITFTTQSILECAEIRKDDSMFLFLPLAHVFARACVYAALLSGTCTVFNRSMGTLINDIKKSRPTWFASVPRIFEKVYSKILSQAEAKGGLALKIFKWACGVGNMVSEYKLAKKPIPLMISLKYKIAEKLVFKKIQAALGGQVRWCISGAAPINPDIAAFFHAADILILEGLGMTENTSFSNINRVDNYRFGWVGQPGPGIEQKIDDDGEVMFRGRNIMKGYYKMPDETANTITSDGWLRTGDFGEIDKDNCLKITGRKKDLIITAGGKNISPAAIEGVIATSKYINQVFVIGDRRKFLTAVVTLDQENIMEYAAENDISAKTISGIINEQKVIQLIKSEIIEKNKNLASFETIKKVKIVPEFTIEDSLLTPTLKLKKNKIYEKYSKDIDGMYPHEGI